jgi:hypothetical protein
VRLLRGTQQGAHCVTTAESFVDNEASDASGRTDDEYGHGGNGHLIFLA